MIFALLVDSQLREIGEKTQLNPLSEIPDNPPTIPITSFISAHAMLLSESRKLAGVQSASFDLNLRFYCRSRLLFCR